MSTFIDEARNILSAEGNSSNASVTPLTLVSNSPYDVEITDIIISVGSAMNVILKTSADRILLNKIYLPANGNNVINLVTPTILLKGETLQVKTSATGNVTVNIMARK